MTTDDYLKRPDAQGNLHVMKMLRKWDPIGVIQDYENPPPEVADEYDSYSAAIVQLLDQGITAEELAKHLGGIRSNQIGSPLPRSRAYTDEDFSIAAELVAWWEGWTRSGRGRA